MSVSTKKSKTKHKSMPRDYSLLKSIRQNVLYKTNVVRRDASSRKKLDIEENLQNPLKLIKGNIYLFKYLEPKTKAELEYYDALPCVLLFGRFTTQEGEKRYLGFNVHYYPPRIRFVVLNKIMEMYSSLYSEEWQTGFDSDLSFLNYKQLIYIMRKMKLDFGVRQYIPRLIKEPCLVTPENWENAVFTEGRFYKKTRELILNYWKFYTSR